MHAGDARPLARVLVGARVGVVRLADVEQIEGRRVRGELQVVQHRRHVVVLGHQPVGVEVAVDGRVLVEHRHRHPGVRAVSEAVLEVGRQEQRGQQALELDVGQAEPLAVAQEVLLVVLRRVDLGRARVRQEPHQQVVVRRRGPCCVAPAPFDRSELRQHLGLGLHP